VRNLFTDFKALIFRRARLRRFRACTHYWHARTRQK